MVRVRGVEPLRLTALEPKSSTSANSAIPAYNTDLSYQLRSQEVRYPIKWHDGLLIPLDDIASS